SGENDIDESGYEYEEGAINMINMCLTPTDFERYCIGDSWIPSPMSLLETDYRDQQQQSQYLPSRVTATVNTTASIPLGNTMSANLEILTTDINDAVQRALDNWKINNNNSSSNNEILESLCAPINNDHQQTNGKYYDHNHRLTAVNETLPFNYEDYLLSNRNIALLDERDYERNDPDDNILEYDGTPLRISAMLRCSNRNEIRNNDNDISIGNNESDVTRAHPTVHIRNEILNSTNEQSQPTVLDLSVITHSDTAQTITVEQPSSNVPPESVVENHASQNAYNVYRNYDPSTCNNTSQEQRQQARESRHSHGHHRHRHSKH
ncbi:unnamed protein product, partial [Didymodactylos carnosus]